MSLLDFTLLMFFALRYGLMLLSTATRRYFSMLITLIDIFHAYAAMLLPYTPSLIFHAADAAFFAATMRRCLLPLFAIISMLMLQRA